MTKTQQRQRHHDDQRRQRQVVVGVEDFAHRKGVTKALQGFRERKEKKRLHTAKALRSYKKVMKQAGYEPGQGASRRRSGRDEVHHDESTSPTHAPTENSASDHPSQQSTSLPPGTNTNPRKPHKRSHLFHKSVQQARERQHQRQQQALDSRQNELERQQKQKQRRERTNRLSQRTSRGQPIMKHMVNDILFKLEKEQQHQQQERELER